MKKKSFSKTIITDEDIAVIGCFRRHSSSFQRNRNFVRSKAETSSAPSALKADILLDREARVSCTEYRTSLWLLDHHGKAAVEPRTFKETKTSRLPDSKTK